MEERDTYEGQSFDPLLLGILSLFLVFQISTDHVEPVIPEALSNCLALDLF